MGVSPGTTLVTEVAVSWGEGTFRLAAKVLVARAGRCQRQQVFVPPSPLQAWPPCSTQTHQSHNKHIFIDIQFQNSNSRNTSSQGIRQDLCSYCTWLSPSRDIYQDQRVGVVGAEHQGHRGQGALIRIQF